MKDLVIVTGVMGCGKTTVSESAVNGTRYRVVNYGEVITKLLKQDSKVSCADDIRKNLDQPTWIGYQKEAAAVISKIVGKVLLTTHITFATPSGYFPGLPSWVLEQFNPKPRIIILIEAAPDEIKRRRESDRSRKRNYVFEENIVEHQEMNRRFAAAYSALTGARISIIHNNDSMFEAAVSRLRGLLI